MAYWDIRGKALWLCDSNSISRIPSVEEIYGALVEGIPIHSTSSLNSSKILYSKYPLIPFLTIDADIEDKPYYTLVGKFQDKEIELEEEDLKRGHTFIDSVWYPLDQESTHELYEIINDLKIIIGPASSLRTFLAIRNKSTTCHLIVDKLSGRIISPLAFFPENDDSPMGIRAKLYTYQLDGWKWLRFLVSEGIGGVLADEMGLGKTLQIICLLNSSLDDNGSPALIIAPGSLLENWKREIEKFSPNLKVLKHHGQFRTGSPAKLTSYNVILTSYDSVVSDNSLLNMIKWKIIVLDEAQFIRNPRTKRAIAVKKLNREVGIAVTGTPMENKLLDIWSIIDFTLQGQFNDSKSFESNYPESLIGAALLEPILSPMMLRRLVRDVAQDLPSRIDIPEIIELEDGEALAYDKERERINSEYGASATLVSLTVLRRFCAHPNLISGALNYAEPLSFSKFRRFNDILIEIFNKKEKVIIFTSFTAMADMISNHINEKLKIFSGIIDGRLEIDKRQVMIDQFGSIEGSAALVLNPRVGGAGLNITAANHVIHYNPEWNPALEDQASARAYRRGQNLPVTVHLLLLANTVEDIVNERLKRKREISYSAVVGIEGKDEDYDDIFSALMRSPSKYIRGEK